MKSALVAMFMFTIFVAGITLVYKSAQSLQFIKPGGGISLSSFGITGQSTTSGQGIWRYTIASGAWQQEKSATRESFSSVHVFEFSRDPSAPQNVYAATSSGLYRYENSQNSWTALAGGIPSDTQILSVSINAQNASHLFVSTLQNDGESEIWRSQNAGETFTRVYQTSGQTEKIVDVVDDWFNPQRVLALTDQGVLLQSDDEGLSWRLSYNLKRTGITHLIMDPNDSRILYALQSSVGILESTNSGSTWESQENTFAALPADAKIVNDLRAVAGVPGRLYLATNYGILRRENREKSFTVVHSLVEDTHTPIQAIALGANTETLFMAAGNILYESRDAGKNWESHPISDAQTINAFIYIGAPNERIFAGI